MKESKAFCLDKYNQELLEEVAMTIRNIGGGDNYPVVMVETGDADEREDTDMVRGHGGG